ncbi:TetR/AcrR family transcriptional regulator [Phenylobacterium sp. LjRoot219]|uniref:TetR/AcrR family transcriptional regulator n=1 Tax=Phenylobacterium sp. LjRoot219 TaxID=3342283 RepID=UPI003ED09F17
MSQSIRRSQAERRSQSERSLLQAAIDVIASAGVGAVTFETLGRASGFSRGLATQRFGSKQKLIEAVLAHLHERQETLLREHRLDERPGLEAILTYVDVCLRDLAQRNEARAYFMLLSSSVAEASELRSGFRQAHAEVEARLVTWALKGKAEGAIRAEVDEHAAALMIGCLMFGQSMQLLVDPAMDLGPLREMSLATLKTSLAA